MGMEDLGQWLYFDKKEAVKSQSAELLASIVCYLSRFI
jgi:hypothetical protein